MSSLKAYLIIASVLLCGAIGAGIYVWYMVQKFDTTELLVSEMRNTLSSEQSFTVT